MLTFVMLTRLSPDALRSPGSLEALESRAMAQIRRKYPDLEWVHNFAILGPCNYLDIFRAPDMETALGVSTIINTFGHATTEIWAATEWRDYKEMLHKLPKAA